MNNRQPSRRRGRGNSSRPQSGNRNGYDNNNRIDNRARGNAAQMLEKYRKLANDTQMNGDRVQAEYYLQFADHYFRVLADVQARQAPRDAQPGRWRDGERDGERDGADNRDRGDDGGGERPLSGYADVSSYDDADDGDLRDDGPRPVNAGSEGPRSEGFRNEHGRNEHGRNEHGRRDNNRSDNNRTDNNRADNNRTDNGRSQNPRSSNGRQAVRGDGGDESYRDGSMNSGEASDDPTDAPRALRSQSEAREPRAPRPRRAPAEKRRPARPAPDAEAGERAADEAPSIDLAVLPPAIRTRDVAASPAESPDEGPAGGPSGGSAGGPQQVEAPPRRQRTRRPRADDTGDQDIEAAE